MSRLPDIIKQLYHYWDGCRRGRGMPRRHDIDPLDIPELLPYIYLIDVEYREDVYFRIRLMGTHLVEIFKKDHTGDYLSNIDLNDTTDIIVREYEQVVETRTPLLSAHDFISDSGRPFDYKRLLLPLSEDGEVVDKLLGAVVFEAPLKSPTLVPARKHLRARDRLLRPRSLPSRS